MFDLDHWREIFNALGSNKLRTLLTAFGVFWGIFMLMIMLGSGNGLENGVTADFGGTATNSFFVWTRSTTKPYRGLPAGRRYNFNNDDIAAVRELVPEAQVIAPRNQLSGFGSGNNVIRGSQAGAFNIYGDYPEYRLVQDMRIVRGRFINQLDINDRRKVAVIGGRVQEVLFEPGEDPIGDHVRINGVYFKVVGVFRSIQSGDSGQRDEETIYTPFTTFQQVFNYGNIVGWFAISAREDVPASVAEEKVMTLLRKRHRIAPDDERAVGHFNLEEEYNQLRGLFAGINGLIWVVGIGTLAAGVIGVSNIMLVIVRERTKEIGIRRAIGARPMTIIGQVVMEAIILTALAGYFGLLAGMGLVEGINWAMDKFGAHSDTFAHPDVSSSTAVQALIILIIAGTLAGLIPAQRAVSVRPVEALRADP